MFGLKLVGRIFWQGVHRVCTGWQQKLLDLDISASGQLLLEVLVSNSDMPGIAAEVAGLADECACCSA